MSLSEYFYHALETRGWALLCLMCPRAECINKYIKALPHELAQNHNSYKVHILVHDSCSLRAAKLISQFLMILMQTCGIKLDGQKKEEKGKWVNSQFFHLFCEKDLFSSPSKTYFQVGCKNYNSMDSTIFCTSYPQRGS